MRPTPLLMSFSGLEDMVGTSSGLRMIRTNGELEMSRRCHVQLERIAGVRLKTNVVDRY